MRKRPGARPLGEVDRGEVDRGGVNRPSGARTAETGGDAAFDRWLDDRLRNSYSSVLEEPIPEDLLRLLEQKLKE